MNDPTPKKHARENMKSGAKFSAVFIGSVAALRMTKGVEGHVHSVFRRVINIEIPNEGLVSLVGHEIGRGPLYISVEIPAHIDFTTIGVEKSHRVIRDSNLIRVSEKVLDVSLENVKLWEPMKQFKDILAYSDIESNLRILLRLVTHFGNHSDLYQLLKLYMLSEEDDKELTMELNPVSRMALPQVVKLLDAIKLGNTENIVQSVMKLVGLGPGLTPAADDFLVGLMLSIFYMAENSNPGKIRVQDALNDILSCIHGRTTRISEEFLLQAAIGNGNEIVQTLLEALLTSNKIGLEQSAQEVMDFGGTSGIDTIIGIIFGVNMMLSDTLSKSHLF